MKKIKIEIVYVLLGLFIVLWINYKTFYNVSTEKNNNSTQVSFEIAKTWSIKSSIEVTWSAELVNEQSLRFTQIWEIDKVNFKAWDKVKKWDIIATIDNTDWQTSVKKAELDLTNAKINLNALYEKKDASSYIQSQNSIDNTKKSIEISKKELENLYTTKTNWLNDIKINIEVLNKELLNLENSLELAQKNLDISKESLTVYKADQNNSLSNTKSNKETTIKQIEDSLNSDIASIEKYIEQIDYILWVTDSNKHKNDDFEIYLSAKNTSYKNDAISNFNTLNKTFLELNKIVANYDKSWDIEKIKSILLSIQSIYKLLETTTDLTYKAIENSVTTSNFTQDNIDGKKSLMYSYKTSSQSKISTLNSTINTLNTLSDTDLINNSINNNISQKESDIISKQDNIKTILLNIEKKKNDINTQKTNYSTQEKNYDLSIQSKINNISNLEKTLSLNEQSLKELDKWPTDDNVSKSKNSIKQAELNLETAKKSLEKYTLVAPFDWVIRKIDYQVWDNILSDSDKYVYIENPNMLQIKVNLDQVDIINVEIWDNAIITFDWYPKDKVKAKVTNIDTTPVINSWVVTYKVILVLDDENFKKTVLSGMTSDIEIITNQKDNVILITTSSITKENDKSYVNVSENNRQIKKEVSVWMTSDGKTEILSWITIWEKIITQTITTSSWTTKSSSLFQIWNSSRSSSSQRSSNSSSSFWPPPF